MEDLQEYFEEKEESNFDLKAEIYKYLTHWQWLLLGFLLGGIIAYLYNRYTIPKFNTTSTILMIDEDEKNAMSALPSSNSQIFSFSEDNLDSEIEKFRSKQLVESVVDELNHNVSYFIEGNVIAVEAYNSSPLKLEFITPDSIVNKTSARYIITPNTGSSFILEKPDSEFRSEYSVGDIIELDELKFVVIPNSNEVNNFQETRTVNVQIDPVREIAANYISKLEIAPKGKASDMLVLSIIEENSQKAEDFLNKLMEIFNEVGVEAKQEVAENTTTFIQNRLEMITSELDSVESGIAEFKQENRIMDVSSGAAEFQSKFSAAEQEIFQLETEIELLNSIEEVLGNKGKYELLPEVSSTGGNTAGLVNSYNSVVLERNRYLEAGTEKNPIVQTLSNQLDNIRQNLFESIESEKSTIRIRLNELDQRENVAQGKFKNFPGLEKGMRSIERQQQIKEQLYLFLLQRREEAAISFASTASVARVIDKAYTINQRVDPKPWIILIAGFIIGLIIPILIIFIKNFLDTKVHHKGDMQPLLKTVPFLGEVPRVSSDQREQIEVNDRSPLAESFRILRTNLAYLLQKKEENVGEIIYVTSTIKGEGKTFISYNMARTLASTGKKVILIGADIRNPKLHRYSEVDYASQRGLSDYLYDYSIEENSIISQERDSDIKVDLILSGPIPPNPAELLMNDRMKQLLNFAKENYDYVLVDTAPTMIVTDTLLISPLADTTLYVVRADLTEKKMLDFPKDLKKQGKLKGLAVILNDVDYSKFSYGAQYGYSYGYGYGYGVDKESRWKRIKRRLFNS